MWLPCSRYHRREVYSCKVDSPSPWLCIPEHGYLYSSTKGTAFAINESTNSANLWSINDIRPEGSITHVRKDDYDNCQDESVRNGQPDVAVDIVQDWGYHVSANTLSQNTSWELGFLYFHLGTFEPAFSSSLKTMYAVSTPPMRKNESTDGKALSTASKASPCEPLKGDFWLRSSSWVYYDTWEA